MGCNLRRVGIKLNGIVTEPGTNSTPFVSYSVADFHGPEPLIVLLAQMSVRDV